MNREPLNPFTPPKPRSQNRVPKKSNPLIFKKWETGHPAFKHSKPDRLLGIFLYELRRPFENALFHDFSSFELQDRAGRDDHFLFGLFGIAADTLLGESCSEDAKFTELDALAIAEPS